MTIAAPRAARAASPFLAFAFFSLVSTGVHATDPQHVWVENISRSLEQQRANARQELERAQTYLQKSDGAIRQSEDALRTAAAAGNAQAETIARRALAGAQRAKQRAERLRRAAETNLRRAEVGVRNARAAANAAASKRARAIATYWKGDSRVFSKRHNRWLPMGDPALGALEEGDRIRTGSDATVEVFLRDGESRVQVAPGTELTLSESGGVGEFLELAFGKFRAQVVKRLGRPFEVRTPAAVCAVRGTIFAVHFDKEHGSELIVFEGSVELRPEGKTESLVVNAGERAAVGRDGTVSAPIAIDAQALDAWWEQE